MPNFSSGLKSWPISYIFSTLTSKRKNILFSHCKYKIKNKISKKDSYWLAWVMWLFLWPDSPGTRSSKCNETFIVRVREKEVPQRERILDNRYILKFGGINYSYLNIKESLWATLLNVASVGEAGDWDLRIHGAVCTVLSSNALYFSDREIELRDIKGTLYKESCK